jgi:nucleoid DNA-binding protein
MAKFLQAIVQYGPRLELQSTAQLDQVSEWMAMRTGLNKSEAMLVFQEMSDAILNFAKNGAPVKFPGVGTFSPSIDRNGDVSINFRADSVLRNGINAPSAYRGAIANKAHIGLENDKFKQLWDTDHPDDPLEL